MSKIVLRADNLSKIYQDGSRELSVLSSVDLALAEGERVAIIGSSGSGKSTLLNLLSGLDTASTGTVTVDGKQLDQLNEKQRAKLRNNQLGFVYQFHHLLPEFSALENVAMPLLLAGESTSRAQERSQSLLSEVGLDARASHKPGQLSGGERQRVAIARALINEPACVFMDEPTGNLDKQTAESVQQLIHHLSERQGTAFLIVTHDLSLADQLDRKLLLEAGQLKPIK